jgi:hypothetical protein
MRSWRLPSPGRCEALGAPQCTGAKGGALVRVVAKIRKYFFVGPLDRK